MNPQIVNIQEAGANFSNLIQTVVSGVEIIVTKEGKPIARITQIKGQQPKIRFGVLKGRIRVSDDFDAPLDETTLSNFEGDECGF